MVTNQSFDRASLAIKYAHEWAESMRWEAVIARVKTSAPAAIYRAKKGRVFAYTIVSGWDKAPADSTLVMIVSASGIERIEGPWATKEFGDAFMEAAPSGR